MVKRDEMLKAVYGDLESLSTFVSGCQSSDSNCLSETVGSCSKKEIEHIWQKTHQLVENTLQSAIQEDEVYGDEIQSQLATVLHDMVAMLAAMLAQKDIFIPESAMLVADLLSQTMSKLPTTDHKMRNSIAKLFEDWWKKIVGGREDLVISSFAYIVERSLDLQPKPLIIDVKRVWSLHEVVPLIDLQNEISVDFCNLLLRCFICPHYLPQDEGRKFLSYVLSVDEQFTMTVHKTIKQHLINMSSTLQRRCGEVYFKAWQRLQGTDKCLKFEQDCIQDLMYNATLAQPIMFPPLKKVLSYFHNHKKMRGVDEMLLRLYEPFLWRFLKSINYQVRENSVQLFFDVFPLNNPEKNVVESDKMLKKQFGLLEELLDDPEQSVRAFVVTGMFNVLKNCWEIIPQALLKKLMVHMLKSLSSVNSSAEIRENIIKGLTILLDNILSHTFLQPLLPQIHKSVHDVSEKVRIAMLELLLKVKGLRTLKFWKIVPVEQLLARLTVDTDPVNRRIVKLLDSFLPLQKDRSEQVQRCIVLIEDNPAAARQYFHFAQVNMSIEDIVNYMLTLCKALIADMLQKKGKTSTDQDEDNDNEDNPEEEEERLDVEMFSDAVVLGLLETICILWTNRKKTLDKECNAALKKNLQKKFCYALEEMMKVYRNPQIMSVVIQIAGYMPSHYVPKMSRTWVPRLRAMTCDHKPEDYGVLLETLCTCNRGPEIVELVTKWLQTGLATETKPTPTKRKRKKRVGFIDPVVPQPQLAVDFLYYIFQNAITREKFLHYYIDECVKMRDLLKQSMDVTERYLTGDRATITAGDKKFLISCLTVYCQLIILIHSVEPETYPCVSAVLEVLSWADKHVIPILSVKEETEPTNTSTHRQLALGITESVLKMFNNLLLVGYGDTDMCTQIVELCTSCTAADDQLELLPAVLTDLYQVTEFIKFLPDNENFTEFNSNIIPTALSRVLASIAGFAKKNPEISRKLLNSVKNHILELMRAIFKGDYRNETITHDIMGTITATVLAEMRFQSQQLNLKEEPSLGSLPPLSSWLVTILQRLQGVQSYFVEELQDCCASGAVTDLHSLHGISHILCALATGPKFHKELQDLYRELDKQTGSMLQDLSEEDQEDCKETILLVKEKSEKCKALLHDIETPSVEAE